MTFRLEWIDLLVQFLCESKPYCLLFTEETTKPATHSPLTYSNYKLANYLQIVNL